MSTVVQPSGMPVVVQPPGMRLRTWISINQDRDLGEEKVYEEVQQDLVNVFIFTFLCVVSSFVLLGLVFLGALRCIHHFRKVWPICCCLFIIKHLFDTLIHLLSNFNTTCNLLFLRFYVKIYSASSLGDITPHRRNMRTICWTLPWGRQWRFSQDSLIYKAKRQRKC